ncbi:MAG TPA: HlyD family efflux transporter periplasmic adaptor subunit, partial [Thermoanaerobaculia bacterium]|nr:HlyD family efflux transporter periplasmic adaptor subunit [Thermoanaerobaculia bacterium]
PVMIQQSDSMDVILEKPSGLSRRSKILIGAAVVLILSLIPLWPALQRWSSADQSVDLARLRIATVTRGDLERDVAADGRIVAANHPRLYSPAEGTVALRVRAGQTVRKGQALATIESPELESQLAQERSRLQSLESELGRARISARQQNVGNDQTAELRRVRLEAARRELQRAEKLRSEGLLNEVEHERAKDAVRLAEVELEQSRQGSRLQREALDFEVTDSSRQVERQRLVISELQRRVMELAVVAPFDGQVATVDVEDRQAVSANAPLLTVVDLSTYEVEIRIPEAYADEIGPGARVEIDYAGRKFPGTLTAVSPEVRESQVEGTVAFGDGPPEGLRQNQRVSVRLVLDRRADVLKVSRGPFLESGGGRKVYVLEDGLATLRDIRTGAMSVGEVEILEGLAEGDQILLTDTQQFQGAESVLVRQ